MKTDDFFFWIFLFFLGYYLVLAVYSFVLGIIGILEDRSRAHQSAREDYQALCSATFTVPISIIIPAHNEEIWIADTVQSILNLVYPEFELIVVNDGSKDRTQEVLQEKLKLKPVSAPYTDRFESGKLLGYYKSEMYSNVTVLHKQSGKKKAGAVNAGLNIARYRYVCMMDSDTILERDALMKVMAHIQKDPDHIVGLGSNFGLANGFKIKNGTVLERNFSTRPLVAYQNLEYIRSFIGTRIAWSRFNAMPIVSGGFAVWRRDFLIEIGAFSPAYSCEDLEVTFRAHEYMRRHPELGYKILMLPYNVGWTEGPATVKTLIQQRDRWHRVTLEAVWEYKHMFLNPRYGSLGFLTVPYFVFYEVLGVFFEVISLAITAMGCIRGIIDFSFFWRFFLLIILFQAVTTLLPLFTFSRDQRILRAGDSLYLVFLSLFEFGWYRWINTWAKIQGTINFLRGKRVFDSVPRHRT